MEAIKNFVAEKSVGWYVSLAATVCALITLIIYAARGGNSYSPVSPAAVTLLVFGIVTNAAALWKDFKVGAFVPYVFYIAAFGVLFNSEMLFVSNVLGGIDNNTFDPAFIACVVFLALTLVCGFAAAIMRLTKRK